MDERQRAILGELLKIAVGMTDEGPLRQILVLALSILGFNGETEKAT